MLTALLSFQVVWFAAVLGAARGLWWLGPCAVAGVAAARIVRTGAFRQTAVLVLGAAVLGFLLDSGLTWAGLLSFPADGRPSFSPLWMTALWVNFALFIPSGLRWLYGRPLLAAALGAGGGPAAYWAGHRLGALEWAAPQAAAAVAAEWAAATPLLCWMASRIERDGDAQ